MPTLLIQALGYRPRPGQHELTSAFAVSLAPTRYFPMSRCTGAYMRVFDTFVSVSFTLAKSNPAFT